MISLFVYLACILIFIIVLLIRLPLDIQKSHRQITDTQNYNRCSILCPTNNKGWVLGCRWVSDTFFFSVLRIEWLELNISSPIRLCLYMDTCTICRSQWPRGLRGRSSAARLPRLWVRIPPGAWMSIVNVVCCQVEVSATNWSLDQRSPTYCGASSCVI